MAGYYERLGDILRDTLDSDEDSFETWDPHGGKTRKAGNVHERTPPPKKAPDPARVTVPHELLQDFRILGIEPGTEPEACKQRWKNLLKQYHPDLPSSSEQERSLRNEKTSQLTNAYRKIMYWYETGKVT